jgi:hypothetical protein
MQTMLAVLSALLTGLAQPEERPQVQVNVTIYRAAVNEQIGFMPPRRLSPDERAQVVVCPTVATVEGKAASIFVGSDVPRLINTVRRVTFVPQGLSLQVTPRGMTKETIALELALENSESGEADKLRTTISGTFVLDQPLMIDFPTRATDRRISARIVVEPFNR